MDDLLHDLAVRHRLEHGAIDAGLEHAGQHAPLLPVAGRGREGVGGPRHHAVGKDPRRVVDPARVDT